MTESTRSEACGAVTKEVLITRVFEAPRELVYAAWTDPDQVAVWYGPEGYTVPRESVTLEPRVGGRFDLTMVSPEGNEIPLRQEFVELDEPQLIVLRAEPMPEHGMTEEVFTRVELHDHGAKTRMTLSDGPFPEAMAGHAEMGWGMALDKLGRHVAA